MEEFTLPIIFALGFLGGFKHAFEPDHVVAVSTLLHREPKLTPALKTGAAWGAGHTTTLFIGVLIIGLLRIQLSESMLAYFEIPVAIMLFGLGAYALYISIARITSLRRHKHDDIEHYHVGDQPHPHDFPVKRSGWQGYGVGMVHGLAGSGAMLLLVAATLPSLTIGLVYALIFGIGSILGMGAVTLVLALPFLASRDYPNFYHILTGISGVLSLFLGGVILYGFVG